MNEIWQTLSGAHGQPSAILAWAASVRVPLKLAQPYLLAAFHRAITSLESNPDPFIAELAARVLQNKLYRLAAWLLDTAASIKLPTVATLHIHKNPP